MIFEQTTIGEYATIQGGFAYKSQDFLSVGNWRVLKIKNIRHGHVDYNETSFVSDEKEISTSNWKTKAGDILISMTGSGPNAPESLVGRVAKVRKSDPISLINQRVGRLVVKNNALIDSDFLFYVLALKESQEYLVTNATGSANQVNISSKTIESLPCPQIDFHNSSLIANTLNALDDRITLLRETNATLEAIAQALFKSWFVDFDPVHAKAQGRQPEGMDEQTAALFPDRFVESELGMVPLGWEVGMIDDVCDFQNGYAFKSTEMSKSKEDTYKIFKMGNIKKGGGLNRSGTKDYFEKAKSKNLDRYLLKKGDLLMCMTDMKNNVVLLGHTALMDIDDEFLVNQRVGMLRSKNKKIANFPFLYLLTNSDFFIADLRTRANSGVQVNLSTQEIKNTKFVLPPEKIHQHFNEVTEAIYEKLFILEQQQDSLADLRDSLLPRLISGQLRLPDVEA
jgi:type I restriction enzyme S subunit